MISEISPGSETKNPIASLDLLIETKIYDFRYFYAQNKRILSI